MTSASEEWDQFSRAYDHPPYGSEPRVYVIASVPRSGSHFLGHILAKTGLFGSPLEYLHPNHLRRWSETLAAGSRGEVLSALYRRRTSPSGWFGVKAHWPHFRDALADPSTAEVLRPERYIFIRRSDLLSQAISLVLARQTGAWISFHDKRSEPVYDFDATRKAMAELEAQESSWREYFQHVGVEPLTVTYEDLVADPNSILSRIAESFEVPLGSEERSISMPKLQATRTNQDWKERFIAEEARRTAAQP